MNPFCLLMVGIINREVLVEALEGQRQTNVPIVF